jgi:hypothetical protein
LKKIKLGQIQNADLLVNIPFKGQVGSQEIQVPSVPLGVTVHSNIDKRQTKLGDWLIIRPAS